MLKRFSKDKNILILLSLALFYAVYHILLFRNTDLSNYPLIYQDFWRRAQDSLYYLGNISTPNFATPLISIVYALFIKINSDAIYLFNIALFIATFLLFYKLTFLLFKNKEVALFSALLFYFNFYSIWYSNYYGLADPLCLFFILLTCFFFIKGLEKRSVALALIAGVSCGLAGLSQYLGIIFAPLLICYAFFIERKKLLDRKSIRYILIFIILSLLIFVSFSIYRKIAVGNFVYSRIQHFGYARLHVDAIGYYLWQSIVYFTPPVVIFSCFGAFRLFKEKNRSILLFLSCFIFFMSFFVFYYIWKDTRFLVYSSPLFLLPAAYGIYKFKVKFSEKGIGLTIFYVILFLILYISNIHNGGEHDLPLLLNHRVGLQYIQNDAGNSQIITISKSHSLNTPYFIYMVDYKNKDNPEINYYLNEVSVKEAIDASEILKGADKSKILAKFGNHYYVRFNQMYYFLEYEINSSDEISSKYEYLITDSEMHGSETPDYLFEEVYRNKLYFVYKIQ